MLYNNGKFRGNGAEGAGWVGEHIAQKGSFQEKL